MTHMSNFYFSLQHFNLEKENLQYLALQVGIISTSLHKQLTYIPESATLQCSIMNDVARIISKVKTLIGWLDRYPFQGILNMI
jgi:Connector enhancer of kinase suppressor of ras